MQVVIVDDLDELRRRSVVTDTAYRQAKDAYLFAVEDRADASVLADAARRVASAVQASTLADWELYQALERAKPGGLESLDARSEAETGDVLTELWDELVSAHEGRLPHPEEKWRPLTQPEKGILEFLLSIGFTGVEELRAQYRVAKARRVNRDSPSIELQVDPTSAPPAELKAEPVAVTTETRPEARAAGRPWFEVYLFASDGYMYALHIGGEYVLDEFPGPDLFEMPRAYPDAAGDDD